MLTEAYFGVSAWVPFSFISALSSRLCEWRTSGRRTVVSLCQVVPGNLLEQRTQNAGPTGHSVWHRDDQTGPTGMLL